MWLPHYLRAECGRAPGGLEFWNPLCEENRGKSLDFWHEGFLIHALCLTIRLPHENGMLTVWSPRSAPGTSRVHKYLLTE